VTGDRNVEASLAIETRPDGEGIPILFLHGDSCRGSQWHDVINRIGEQAPTATFDFRGHGGSAAARDGDYGFGGRADDIASVADTLGWQRFLIVAHSGGCGAALRFLAVGRPAVAGLLMVEPPADPSSIPPAVKEQMLHDLAGPQGLTVQRDFYASIAGPNESTRATVLRDIETTAAEARMGTARALFDWDARAALDGVDRTAAFLLAHSGDTPAGLHRLRPDIPHTIVASDGHWVHLDDAARVADMVLDFRDGSGVR